MSNNLQKLPVTVAQLGEFGSVHLCHVAQWDSELLCASDHGKRSGVPARAPIGNGYFLLNAACLALASEFGPTLRRGEARRGADLGRKAAEPVDARERAGWRGGVLGTEIGILDSCTQLAQQRLRSQIRDVGHDASNVLLLASLQNRIDTTSAARAFQAIQELVDVGGVVGGDAQKPGE